MDETAKVVNDWEGFEIPKPIRNPYKLGHLYPKKVPQLVIELAAFRLCRMSKKNIPKFGLTSAFDHALKICQLLWSNEVVCTSKKYHGIVALNTYFLDVLSDLCTFEDVALTGPASCAKTYTVSIFDLINFYSAPSEFMGLISTTSASASERRVWGDIKSLHRAAMFDENNITIIGEVIEHIKCLTFNPAKNLGREMNERDLRNGVIVIPVSNDSKGEAALNTIMGSKNKMVSWTVDEAPAMPNDIMTPRGALESNPYFQFIITGNAAKKSDPHGQACEPFGGWASINRDSKRWKALTCNVLFLDGEKGPNEIYGLPECEERSDLPFPYLSNRFVRDKNSIIYGRGDKELGRSTNEYWRFCIGYWIGSDITQTVLSEASIKFVNADRPPMIWGSQPRRVFGGFDPGFASGGDVNALVFMEVGYDIGGNFQLLIDSSAHEIRPRASTNEEYRKLVAKQVVELCKNRGVKDISDLAADGSADGGLMCAAIEVEWQYSGITQLSSLEKSTNERYYDRVTQYWMVIRELLETKSVCGFNIVSNYSKDLFDRRFESAKGIFRVETKKTMKKRINKSPDSGDAFSYCSYLVWSSGVVPNLGDSVTERRETELGQIADLLYYRFYRGKARQQVDGYEDLDSGVLIGYDD